MDCVLVHASKSVHLNMDPSLFEDLSLYSLLKTFVHKKQAAGQLPVSVVRPSDSKVPAVLAFYGTYNAYRVTRLSYDVSGTAHGCRPCWSVIALTPLCSRRVWSLSTVCRTGGGAAADAQGAGERDPVGVDVGGPRGSGDQGTGGVVDQQPGPDLLVDQIR